MRLVFSEKAVIMDEYYNGFTASDWREAADPTNKRVIRTPNKAFVLPDVVRLLEFDKIISRPINLTRQNIFLRDGFKCQYCGITTDLTLDHIIPKSRASDFQMDKKAINSWENITTCCKSCNNSKDNKTPDEADMVLSSNPIRPSYSIGGLDVKIIKPAWKNYIKKGKTK